MPLLSLEFGTYACTKSLHHFTTFLVFILNSDGYEIWNFAGLPDCLFADPHQPPSIGVSLKIGFILKIYDQIKVKLGYLTCWSGLFRHDRRLGQGFHNFGENLVKLKY